MCKQHLPGDLVDRLNALPANSPEPFGYARQTAPLSIAKSVPPPAASTTILNSGPSSNRVDIVIVGDGYQSAQLNTYASHAANFVNNFFNDAPFNVYKSFFNVHRVDVISTDSGVDNDPANGTLKNTALDMGFWCSGIERLLCVNTTKANSYAVNAPQVDQTIAIANSIKYGGAGYSGNNLGTYSGGNASALEIARHEFGHSFADLADEYDYADNTTYTGGERPEANVSIRTAAQMAASNTKWARWLDLPEVDTFQGAYYSQFGIYRPTFDSKMRSLDRPFEAVNAEQLVIYAYQTVKPIDSATAPGSYNQGQVFNVDPVDPIGSPLTVQWIIDGNVVGSGLSLNSGALNLSGNKTLTLRVVDNTPLVRDANARNTWMTDTRTYTILDNVAPTATGSFDMNLPRMAARLQFNDDVATSLAAGDFTLTNLTTSVVVPSSQVSVVFDSATRRATVTYTGNPRGILPDGNYRLRLNAASVADPAGNVNSAAIDTTFRVFVGDATSDGSINFSDLLIVAQNYNTTGRNHAQGDFDYDGAVNFNDLLVLAQKYNTSLASVVAPRSSSRRSVRADVLA
jgi:hypothetical protein